jgi:hypothetical protein
MYCCCVLAVTLKHFVVLLEFKHNGMPSIKIKISLVYTFITFFFRMESAPKLAPPSSSSRPLTPVDLLNSHNKSRLPSPQHRSNMKKTSPKPNHLASSLGCIPRHSPLHASPSYPSSRSPPRGLPSQHKSPPSLPASLPVIGLDDSDLGFGSSYTASQHSQQSLIPPRVSPDYTRTADDDGVVPPADEIGILSETSSSDSSDSSGSDSEQETHPSNSTVTINGKCFYDKIFFFFDTIYIQLLELDIIEPEFYTGVLQVLYNCLTVT